MTVLLISFGKGVIFLFYDSGTRMVNHSFWILWINLL
ncbi:hypothetical protein R0011_08378 [Lacticaseibacillus rhamnosus R0011]|nr:hypothetical protein LRH_00827 [Lacticaseibacillus rhamnosus HN001]EHJ22092.1 hypothetical protein R0011_08378 [Lacticaseibacillus rhamnosus R0011]